MNRVAVLGATGSIGRQVLDVVERLEGRVRIVAMAANRNADDLASLARHAGVKRVGLADVDAAGSLSTEFTIYSGIDGLEQMVTADDVDIVVVATAGVIGLCPTVAAVNAGKNIALASKEVLVAAGELVTTAARHSGSAIVPIDSEHSAIFQCLAGRRNLELAGSQHVPNNEPTDDLEAIVLTASGGPFRDDPSRQRSAVRDEALRHPTWNMGPLVTVNSATLMNKALEVVEAHWLFGTPLDRIEVLIHPQSIVHSMVRFKDGSIVAQLGPPDMRLPIQYALVYPERIDTRLPRLDLARCGPLTFEEPDLEGFPCLRMGYEAVRRGGTTPAAMNGANEAAVELFLQERIRFHEIALYVRRAMDCHEPNEVTLGSVIAADRWARQFVAKQADAVVS